MASISGEENDFGRGLRLHSWCNSSTSSLLSRLSQTSTGPELPYVSRKTGIVRNIRQCPCEMPAIPPPASPPPVQVENRVCSCNNPQPCRRFFTGISGTAPGKFGLHVRSLGCSAIVNLLLRLRFVSRARPSPQARRRRASAPALPMRVRYSQTAVRTWHWRRAAPFQDRRPA